ncbi:hypothetical protein F4604DRAFT_1692018 [Suillus subluteus]|nr:hypothetical protein F4604DRAFT_1692018 [Suillus subluteus]
MSLLGILAKTTIILPTIVLRHLLLAGHTELICGFPLFSLLTEVDPQGKHILHRDIRAKWADLEQKMLWCMEHLGAGLFILWGTKLPCAPTTYGYQRWHTDANLAKKIAVRSHDAFLLIAATCSWYIMSRQYQGSDRAWMAILMGDPQHPIPVEWVLELSRSFVGDLTTNVPSVTRATEAVQWEQTPDTWGQPDDSAWGQQDDSTWGQLVNNGQSALGWDGSVVGWGQNSGAQPVSDVPEAHADSQSQ